MSEEHIARREEYDSVRELPEIQEIQAVREVSDARKEWLIATQAFQMAKKTYETYRAQKDMDYNDSPNAEISAELGRLNSLQKKAKEARTTKYNEYLKQVSIAYKNRFGVEPIDQSEALEEIDNEERLAPKEYWEEEALCPSRDHKEGLPFYKNPDFPYTHPFANPISTNSDFVKYLGEDAKLLGKKLGGAAEKALHLALPLLTLASWLNYPGNQAGKANPYSDPALGVLAGAAAGGWLAAATLNKTAAFGSENIHQALNDKLFKNEHFWILILVVWGLMLFGRTLGAAVTASNLENKDYTVPAKTKDCLDGGVIIKKQTWGEWVTNTLSVGLFGSAGKFSAGKQIQVKIKPPRSPNAVLQQEDPLYPAARQKVVQPPVNSDSSSSDGSSIASPHTLPTTQESPLTPSRTPEGGESSSTSFKI